METGSRGGALIWDLAWGPDILLAARPEGPLSSMEVGGGVDPETNSTPGVGSGLDGINTGVYILQNTTVVQGIKMAAGEKNEN